LAPKFLRPKKLTTFSHQRSSYKIVVNPVVIGTIVVIVVVVIVVVDVVLIVIVVVVIVVVVVVIIVIDAESIHLDSESNFS
jgi:hypothetical protein